MQIINILAVNVNPVPGKIHFLQFLCCTAVKIEYNFKKNVCWHVFFLKKLPPACV